MLGLADSLIPQCKSNRHKGTCLDLFQAIGHFEPTIIEACQASKIIWKVRSLKLRIKTRQFLEEIKTLSNEVFKDFVSDMTVKIRKLGNPTRETAEKK